jgi:hypothetical protein
MTDWPISSSFQAVLPCRSLSVFIYLLNSCYQALPSGLNLEIVEVHGNA